MGFPLALNQVVCTPDVVLPQNLDLSTCLAVKGVTVKVVEFRMWNAMWNGNNAQEK